MWRHYPSPFGPIAYRLHPKGYCLRLCLGALRGPVCDDPIHRWLDAYFRACVLPLPPLAGPKSPFQAALRRALAAVPFGEVCTYGDLAARLGSAPRAVGQALRANPIPILVPCHRIVAAHGLGGFAWQAEWKRRLLAFERTAQSLTSRWDRCQ